MFTLDKLNKTLFSCLFIIISSVLYFYSQSYPATLLQGNNTLAFYPFLWLGLGLSFFSILCVLYKSNNKSLSLVLCVLFIILFTLPSFFYYSEGSDSAGGFSGSLQTVLTHGFGTDYSNLKTYSQWPNFVVFTVILSNLIATPLNTIQKITMLSIIFVTTSNFFIYFSKYNTKPAINVILYFLTFYIFLNWQPVPQVFGLALFLVSINLLKKGPEYRFLLIVTFISLVFTHAFVSLWFLFLLFLTYVLKRAFTKEDLGIYLNSLYLFSIIQISYIMCIAKLYFISLASLFTKHGSKVNHELSSHQVIIKNGASSLTYQSFDKVDLLTKYLAQFNTIVLLSLLFVCVIISVKQKKIKLMGLGLFFAGIIHFILGIFASVLGSRGLQISFIPFAGQIEHQNFSKYSKIVIFLILLVALLFPANLYRMNFENTHYIINADEYGHNFFIKNVNTAKYQHLVTNGVDGGRLGNLQMDNLQLFNLRDEDTLSTNLNKISLILYNEKFNAELRKIPHPKELDENNVNSDSKFKKIYDSFYQKLYIVTR